MTTESPRAFSVLPVAMFAMLYVSSVQTSLAQNTVLPTDVVPVPSRTQRFETPNPLQLRIWQSLPSKFYFNASVESTFRLETNVYQNPTKRAILRKELPPGSITEFSVPQNIPQSTIVPSTQNNSATIALDRGRIAQGRELIAGDKSVDKRPDDRRDKSLIRSNKDQIKDIKGQIAAFRRQIRGLNAQSSADGTQVSNDSDLNNANVITNTQLQAIFKEISHASVFDNVYRINPNVTAGWSVTKNTQVFGTYFLLRDSLMHRTSLNSTTQAVGLGAQYTWNIRKKGSIQPQITVRELYQSNEPNVLDYLPAVTAQYQVTPRLSVYENSLLQVRFKHFVDGPMRELDPFHTVGFFYSKGGWAFSGSGTFLQNFRKPFGRNALLPINNNSIILDFEIDRQISPAIPGLQALIRAEPVYNFSSHNTSGLSGMDFRLYYGIRLSAAKPALAGNIQQLRNRYLQNVPSARDIDEGP